MAQHGFVCQLKHTGLKGKRKLMMPSSHVPKSLMILDYGTIIITDYLDKGGKHKGEEHNFVLIFVVWL